MLLDEPDFSDVPDVLVLLGINAEVFGSGRKTVNMAIFLLDVYYHGEAVTEAFDGMDHEVGSEVHALDDERVLVVVVFIDDLLIDNQNNASLLQSKKTVKLTLISFS
eukprot:TRINITY_DN11217_c0_g1_i2.p3 TRINITY_DN11217_c0_g1~~TRINITY_DN11217_c0_g1_i2.p3  ORF type:complete len:107 (+),score=16.26 TRINITY_DN11217_c0_g1_i2:394-714(+)